MTTTNDNTNCEVEKLFFSSHEHQKEPTLRVEIDANEEAKLVRRIDIRLVPASIFFYLLCFLDLTNIGNAKILNSSANDDLEQTLHLSDQQYLVVLMVFLVSYTVFKIPSCYLLKKFKPSRWFAFLMFAWGSCTMLVGVVKNFAGLAILRFLLALFEAGLFPGIVYSLTFWYKQDE